MQTITNINEMDTIKDNCIIGRPQKMNSSLFEFEGVNNIVYFDKSVILDNTSIRFYGSNSVVFLTSSARALKLKIDIYNESIFYVGKNCTTTHPLHIVVGERKHIFIGNTCLFSKNIWFRNSDPHLIYDTNTKKRINHSQSIYIGDHVWIGQDVLISKGTQIGSGSIIGGKALTSARKYPSNCSFGGVPAILIKKHISWLKPSVNTYGEEDTIANESYQSNQYIYQNDGHQLSFDDIDKNLCSLKDSKDKYDYLYNTIYLNKQKNCFFIKLQDTKQKSLFSFLKKKKRRMTNK